MQNKNIGLIVSVVVLSLLVVGLGSFVIYDKLVMKKSIQNCDTSEVEISSNNENNEVRTANDYQLFAKNLKSQFSKFDSYNQSEQFVESDAIRDGYDVYLTENGSLFIKYYNEELNDKYGDYKIADNVLSFYVISYGQSFGNMLYFINEDGTVGSANTEYGIFSNNQIIIEKDIGYKNIVSIINGIFGDGMSGMHGPIFIDINGNIFSKNLD